MQHGNLPKKRAKEQKLFETGQFSDHDPLVLQRTRWWCLSLHFGFRARDESRKLCWGDLLHEKDPETGQELLEWQMERGSKHGKEELKLATKDLSVRNFFATGDARCPVNLYKTFEKHRPVEMKKPEAPFYLAVKHKRNADDPIWYMK